METAFLSIRFSIRPTNTRPVLELDATGQPTQRISETRRTAQFITPIPKPRKRRESPTQEDLEFDDGAGYPPQATL